MNKTNTVEQTASGQDVEASGATIESLLDWLRGEFEGVGINAGLAGLLVNVAGALLLVFLSWFAYLVAKRVVLRVIRFQMSCPPSWCTCWRRWCLLEWRAWPVSCRA